MVLNTRASPIGMPIFWLASIGCYFPNWMRPAFAAVASSLETPSKLQIQIQTEFDKRGQLALRSMDTQYITLIHWYVIPISFMPDLATIRSYVFSCIKSILTSKSLARYYAARMSWPRRDQGCLTLDQLGVCSMELTDQHFFWSTMDFCSSLKQ